MPNFIQARAVPYMGQIGRCPQGATPSCSLPRASHQSPRLDLGGIPHCRPILCSRIPDSRGTLGVSRGGPEGTGRAGTTHLGLAGRPGETGVCRHLSNIGRSPTPAWRCDCGAEGQAEVTAALGRCRRGAAAFPPRQPPLRARTAAPAPATRFTPCSRQHWGGRGAMGCPYRAPPAPRVWQPARHTFPLACDAFRCRQRWGAHCWRAGSARRVPRHPPSRIFWINGVFLEGRFIPARPHMLGKLSL